LSNARYIYLTFLLAGACAGLAFRSGAVAILLSMGAADTVVGGILPLSTIIGLFGAVLTFFVMLKLPLVVQYTDECISELVKVTWPDREETTNNSMVVIVATLIFSGSLAAFDFVWAKVTDLFIF
jgi:preprotein translocase SecE subunit